MSELAATNLVSKFGSGRTPRLGCVIVNLLIHDERDEEPHFGDLDGNGLDVHAVNAILNQVELAAIIQFVESKGFVDAGNLFFQSPTILSRRAASSVFSASLIVFRTR